jgi:hypothetical protein
VSDLSPHSGQGGRPKGSSKIAPHDKRRLRSAHKEFVVRWAAELEVSEMTVRRALTYRKAPDSTTEPGRFAQSEADVRASEPKDTSASSNLPAPRSKRSA